VVVKCESESEAELLSAQTSLITGMANLASLEVGTGVAKPAESSVALSSGMEIYVPLSGLVDFDAERTRLRKECKGLEADVAKFSKKLSNPGFLSKAAPEIIEKDRAKLADLEAKLGRVKAQLAEIE
ncbi:MAG: valine--tRNA ligase, partial [Eggerthellaceae bacterium]|nr:valine--tRNA ligase [Eggerthellaceae bacterium]